VLHVTNRGDCTWYEFAEAILQEMGLAIPVLPITTRQAGRLAQRPAYSVLASDRLGSFGISLPHWREALRRFMSDREVPLAASN
jgi:dTDP-4-dehydrorhamnose reductase